MFGFLIFNKGNRKRTTLLLLIFFTVFRLSAQKGETVLGRYVSPEGDTLPYQLYTSSGMDSLKRYPLILWLHGKGERGNDNEKQAYWTKKWLPDSLEKHSYKSFLLSPQCSKDRMWNHYDKFAKAITFDTITPEIQITLMELLEELEQQLPIDTTRIYIMGISMGGFGVFDLITRFPKRFAAAIPICGGADPQMSDSLLKTPIWAFHGEVDELVDKRHTIVPMEKIKDEEHLLTIYPKINHGCWKNAFLEPELLKWMFSNRK